MLTVEAALMVVYNRIKNKATHPDYVRTVELATLYGQLITGEDHDSLLDKFFCACDKEEKEKLKAVTFPITSSICNSLIAAFKKVLRTQPVLKQIDFNNKTADEFKESVTAKLNEYYSGADLENYISTRFHDLTFLDPNTFIVTEFKPFDHKTEKASPYPFEVPAAQAVNFESQNGVLQFLLVEEKISFLNAEKKPTEGVRLIMYLENEGIIFTETAKTNTAALKDDEAVVSSENSVTTYIFKERQFEVTYFKHKQGAVPAVRIGYVPDKKTNGRTFVSPIHYGALPYLMKSIKTVCEMDLSMHLHTFPQKYSYVETCKLDQNGVCGLSNERIDQCSKCNKDGRPLHKSAKDAVTFPLPKTMDELFDLEKLSAYKFPPIEGIKFQDEYIEKLKFACYKGVFNSETFQLSQVEKTATGEVLDLQNVYDTLSDYANKISDYWVKTVTFVSVILDAPRAECNHKLVYPKDFKLKTVTDLLNDLKLANDSASPSFVKTEITRDIANIIYMDRPNQLRAFEVKMRLYPFTGKNANEILMILNASMARKLDGIIYTYFDRIIEELADQSLRTPTGFDKLLSDELKTRYEKSVKDGNIWFYDLPDAIQEELLSAKAQEILDEIESEQQGAVDFTAPSAAGVGA